MRGIRIVGLVAALFTAVLAPSAAGQEATPSPTPSSTPQPGTPSTVTLKLSRSPVTYGAEVTLSGRVDPVVPENVVRILGRDGSEIATAQPEPDGKYAVKITPEQNVKVRAYWLEAQSDERVLKVAPRVKVSLRKVQLFGRAHVSVSVVPASDSPIRLIIKRNGKTYRKFVRRAEDGSFTRRFRVTKLGRFKARAHYQPEGLKIGTTTTTTRRSTPPSNLDQGSRGIAVKRLEWRLKSLGYYIPKVDRSYGADTRDAVIAFNKVQRRARLGSVDEGTWRSLSSPLRAQPRVGKGSHIEVDQTRQVLLVVRKGKVRWILHTSTGAGGASRDGTWTVHRKIAGYSPGRLYYPSYYDGLRAVHGWPEVPTYPASHGCARVPMWSATWIHSKMPMGTTVHVYH